jgi:hypothetical protein
VPHRQRANVEETFGAVRHAAFFTLIELAVLDSSCNALLEADIGQGVNSYQGRGK